MIMEALMFAANLAERGEGVLGSTSHPPKKHSGGCSLDPPPSSVLL